MKKNIVKNYIYNLAYQLLVIVLPILTTPYISRVLGAENIGVYGYTISIVTYFITFGSLGVALYGQREIAYNQDNIKKRSKIFWEIVLFRFITLAISMILFYFIFAYRNSDYSIYYKVLLIEIIANMFDISWFFRGLEEFKKTVVRNMLVKLVTVASVFIFVKTKQDLLIYFYIYVLSTLLGNLSLWLYLPRFIQKVKFKQLKIWKHLRPTVGLFIPQIAIQVYTLLDKTMIGTIIADKSEVGFYEQAQKIIKILLTIITSLGTVMMPRIANTFAEGDKEKIREYMNKSFNMVCFLGFPIMFGLIAVSNAFVPVFFGNGYDKVSILMKVISPIIILIGLSNVTGTQYLLPIKRQKEFTLSVVCGALMNFVLNSLLIPKYGAMGASIGTVVAELTVTTVQFLYCKNDFDYYKLLKMSFNYLFASVMMFMSCLFVSKIIESNMISIFSQVLVGGIIYFVILLIVKDDFLRNIINGIRGKFNKRKEV